LFAVSKAFALASSMLNLQKAISDAMAAEPWPANIPQMAAVAAVGGQLIAEIQSIGAQGFAKGGYTGSGSRSAVAGVVHGQEFVVNAAATARNREMLERINRGGKLSAANITVNVNNSAGAQIDVQENVGTDGKVVMDILVSKAAKAAEANMAAGVASGTGLFNRSLQKSFGLRRGR
jgi:phage-related minor tail protein